MKREEFLNTLFENIPDYTKEERGRDQTVL